MEMKYYNASNNFSAPIPRVRREPKPYIPPTKEEPKEKPPERMQPENNKPESIKLSELPVKHEKTGFLSDLSQDDMIILGIIFLLLLNSCDDYLLLLVLGYLFISGRENK